MLNQWREKPITAALNNCVTRWIFFGRPILTHSVLCRYTFGAYRAQNSSLSSNCFPSDPHVKSQRVEGIQTTRKSESSPWRSEISNMKLKSPEIHWKRLKPTTDWKTCKDFWQWKQRQEEKRRKCKLATFTGLVPKKEPWNLLLHQRKACQ